MVCAIIFGDKVFSSHFCIDMAMAMPAADPTLGKQIVLFRRDALQPFLSAFVSSPRAEFVFEPIWNARMAKAERAYGGTVIMHY